MRLGSDRYHWIWCVSVGRMRVIDRQWICKQDKRTEEEVEARYKRGEASVIAENEEIDVINKTRKIIKLKPLQRKRWDTRHKTRGALMIWYH